jgi:hypothetical protein
MFGKYNGFVSKARVSACMYFLVIACIVHLVFSTMAYFPSRINYASRYRLECAMMLLLEI